MNEHPEINQPTDPLAPRHQSSQPLFPPLAPLYAALAKAQASFGPIERSRTVKVQPKKRDDGSWPQPYFFDYAPLEEVLRKCLPALNQNGLALFHRLDEANGGWRMTTTLAHQSGAAIEMPAFVPRSAWQELGSAITYARRYSVQCLLGVAAEYDDDGNAADGNSVEQSQAKAPKTQPKPPSPRPAAAAPKSSSQKPAEPPAETAKPASVPPPGRVAGAPSPLEPKLEAVSNEVKAWDPEPDVSGTEPLKLETGGKRPILTVMKLTLANAKNAGLIENEFQFALDTVQKAGGDFLVGDCRKVIVALESLGAEVAGG